MTEIRVDVDIEHPPVLVWRALTEAHLVTDWLPTTRFMVRENGTFTFQASQLEGMEDPSKARSSPARHPIAWSCAGKPRTCTRPSRSPSRSVGRAAGSR